MILTVLIPLASYFIIKQFSVADIPQPVFADTTISKTVKGKIINETIWHKIPDFTLTNQHGEKVSLHDMVRVDPETGDTVPKIIVANFFFTHCATICPGMTMNIKKLQESIKKSQKVGDRSADFVQFLSFSVDPDRDSVPQLKKWADRFQVNPEQWWLLTGNKQMIYNMGIHEMRVPLEDGEGVDTSFFHTDKFVLIDTNRHVRGYYSGLDSASLARLSRDIIMLTMEKDPKRKSFLAGKLEIMAVAFIAAIVGVGLLVYFIKRKK